MRTELRTIGLQFARKVRKGSLFEINGHVFFGSHHAEAARIFLRKCPAFQRQYFEVVQAQDSEHLHDVDG